MGKSGSEARVMWVGRVSTGIDFKFSTTLLFSSGANGSSQKTVVNRVPRNHRGFGHHSVQSNMSIGWLDECAEVTCSNRVKDRFDSVIARKSVRFFESFCPGKIACPRVATRIKDHAGSIRAKGNGERMRFATFGTHLNPIPYSLLSRH